MKALILHDTQFGNGEKVAQTLGKVFEKEMDVTVKHVTTASVEETIKDLPDVLIVGAAIRAFTTNGNSKKFIKKLQKELRKQNKTIPFGAIFVTHALPIKAANGWGKRFHKVFTKGKVIETIYPEWISGRVSGQEGPLQEGVLETIKETGKEILGMVKKE